MAGDRTEMVAISGEKLKAEVQSRYPSVNALQKELGCGNAIENAIKRNKIQKPLHSLLTMYGFDMSFDSLTTGDTEKCDKALTADELQGIIKSAVVSALKECL